MTAIPQARRRSFRRTSRWLWAYYWVLLVLLFLPIAMLVLFAVNVNTTLSFPLRGLTLDWFARVFDTPALLRAAGNSLLVGVGSSIVATILGTGVAILFVRFGFRGRWLLLGLAVLPLIVPYVVLAGALLVLFRAFDIDRSLLTVAVAHVDDRPAVRGPHHAGPAGRLRRRRSRRRPWTSARPTRRLCGSSSCRSSPRRWSRLA